jgi:hypothetical protein
VDDDRAGWLGRPVKHHLSLELRLQLFVGFVWNDARLIIEIGVIALRRGGGELEGEGGDAGRQSKEASSKLDHFGVSR